MIKPIFRQLIDKETSTYTYILADAITKDAVIIDPVSTQIHRDLLLIRELGITLRFILETHIHADHITSAAILRAKTGAKVVYSRQSALHCADILVDDKEELQVGSLTIRAFSTPGHTNSCMSLYCQEMVFTGDSLMIRGTGRTDFQNGSSEMLYHSIHKKLFTLPNNTLVYPGHNYSGIMVSTIQEEKLFNPRIREGISLQEFITIMLSLNLAKPEKLEIAVPANMNCGKLIPITVDELYLRYQNLKETEIILDVRSASEYKVGHIPKSKNISLAGLLENLNALRRYRLIYIHCQAGGRAKQAAEILEQQGVPVILVYDGIAQWEEKGYPIERGM